MRIGCLDHFLHFISCSRWKPNNSTKFLRESGYCMGYARGSVSMTLLCWTVKLNRVALFWWRHLQTLKNIIRQRANTKGEGSVWVFIHYLLVGFMCMPFTFMAKICIVGMYDVFSGCKLNIRSNHTANMKLKLNKTIRMSIKLRVKAKYYDTIDTDKDVVLREKVTVGRFLQSEKGISRLGWWFPIYGKILAK